MYNRQAQGKYNKLKKKHYGINLHRVNDRDVIEWLDSQDSIQGAIKALIRKEIEEKKDNE